MIDYKRLGFVHSALFKSIRTQDQRVVGDEKSIKAVIRDWEPLPNMSFLI